MTEATDAEHLADIAAKEEYAAKLRHMRDALTLDIRAADEALLRARCALRESRWAALKGMMGVRV